MLAGVFHRSQCYCFIKIETAYLQQCLKNESKTTIVILSILLNVFFFAREMITISFCAVHTMLTTPTT